MATSALAALHLLPAQRHREGILRMGPDGHHLAGHRTPRTRRGARPSGLHGRGVRSCARRVHGTAGPADPQAFANPADPALVRTLYHPLFQALCRVRNMTPGATVDDPASSD